MTMSLTTLRTAITANVNNEKFYASNDNDIGDYDDDDDDDDNGDGDGDEYIMI